MDSTISVAAITLVWGSYIEPWSTLTVNVSDAVGLKEAKKT